MTPNSHSVIGGIENVGVFQLAHLFELGHDAPDFDVDILAARELASDLIANGTLVSILPNAAHLHLVAKSRVSVMKRMLRQVVAGKWWLPFIGRRQRVFVGVIRRPILREQFGSSITSVREDAKNQSR